MRRRSFLAGASGGVAVVIAGCLGDDESDDETVTDEEHIAELRAETDDRGVTVREVDLGDGVVTVEHGYEEPNDAVANVSMAFVERVADGWAVERLDGYMRTDAGAEWTWHAEAEWAREYADGEIGPEEYGRRISETIAMVLQTDD